jgi:hypothetical protein
MLPHGFLDRFGSELGLIALQTKREYGMQWRREPNSPAVDHAVATSEKLNQHLSKSIQMLRAQQHVPEVSVQTPLPTVSINDQETKAAPMTNPAPGSFAASIKAMLDEAKAGLAQARAEGLATVQQAVAKLNDAKAATAKVAGNMAKTIEEEAASALSELGQVSNDIGGEV